MRAKLSDNIDHIQEFEEWIQWFDSDEVESMQYFMEGRGNDFSVVKISVSDIGFPVVVLFMNGSHFALDSRVYNSFVDKGVLVEIPDPSISEVK